jgi:hypothetical protein
LEQSPPPCDEVLGGVSPTHKFLGHDFSFAKNHLYNLLAMSRGRDPEAEAARWRRTSSPHSGVEGRRPVETGQ